jgi:hypothetical protein
MAKANVTSNNWLKLLFNATAIANIADNAATSPITTIAVALHTADPALLARRQLQRLLMRAMPV